MPAVATPIRVRGEVPPPPRPGPDAGQHTDEVLLEAGFSRDEIAALRAGGVAGG
jgi:crotonobetainyl-CoA:carnitine CoA-transferase CaiB-like acyl-CoA transferase